MIAEKLMTTEADGLVAKARVKLKLVERKAEELEAKGLKEVEEQREALGREVAVIQRHQERHEGRVELDVGGVRYVASIETLRRVPHTFSDAYFSGRYEMDQTRAASSSTGTGSCSSTYWSSYAIA